MVIKCILDDSFKIMDVSDKKISQIQYYIEVLDMLEIDFEYITK